MRRYRAGPTVSGARRLEEAPSSSSGVEFLRLGRDLFQRLEDVQVPATFEVRGAVESEIAPRRPLYSALGERPSDGHPRGSRRRIFPRGLRSRRHNSSSNRLPAPVSHGWPRRPCQRLRVSIEGIAGCHGRVRVNREQRRRCRITSSRSGESSSARRRSSGAKPPPNWSLMPPSPMRRKVRVAMYSACRSGLSPARRVAVPVAQRALSIVFGCGNLGRGTEAAGLSHRRFSRANSSREAFNGASVSCVSRGVWWRRIQIRERRQRASHSAGATPARGRRNGRRLAAAGRQKCRQSKAGFLMKK